MFVNAFLLHIYFYNININLSKYRMASIILGIFLSKSKYQHICFYGNHGSNIGVDVVSVAES